jgi:hypothetical protein
MLKMDLSRCYLSFFVALVAMSSANAQTCPDLTDSFDTSTLGSFSSIDVEMPCVLSGEYNIPSYHVTEVADGPFQINMFPAGIVKVFVDDGVLKFCPSYFYQIGDGG